MAITDLLKSGQKFLGENSTTILTGIGVTGTVTTAYLTGRASFKAAEVIDRAERKASFNSEERGPTFKEKVKLVWPLYIPPVGVGTVTIASIIMANHIGSKRTAAMAAAYGISERAFTEYKAKVVEKLGETKEQAVRDEIAQDRVNKNPVPKEVIIAGNGEVLCYDNLTGRYFMSSVETLRKAQNTVNADIINHMYASLSSFYDEIGVPPTAYSDDVGWNTDNLVELCLSTTMSTDGRPCIVVDFDYGPIPNYNYLY